MKKLTFCLLLALFSQVSLAQSKYVFGSSGPSWHGSGDMRGFQLQTGYGQQFNRYLGYELSLQSTAHHTSTNVSGVIFRFATTGLQANAALRFPIINRMYQLAVVGGVMARRQHSTMPEMYGTSIDNSSPVKYISTIRYGDRPMTTLSLGYLVQIENAMKVTDRTAIGFRIGFQNDQNGDVITSIPLIVKVGL